MKQSKARQRLQTNSTTILCPFFHGHSRVEMQCEGILPDTLLSTIYRRPTDKTEHLRRYCEQRYQLCPFYRLIAQKYEDEL